MERFEQDWFLTVKCMGVVLWIECINDFWTFQGTLGKNRLHTWCDHWTEEVWGTTSRFRLFRSAAFCWHWGKETKTCTFCSKCTGIWFPEETLHGFYFMFNLQIFVGKIPRDLFEDELVPLFEKAGPIWDLRLMMDPLTGLNRGYAFVTFCTKEAAQEAVKLVSFFFSFSLHIHYF